MSGSFGATFGGGLTEGWVISSTGILSRETLARIESDGTIRLTAELLLQLSADGDASMNSDSGAVILEGADGVQIVSIKSGATQGAAGAVADELWKTASHATLPDDVILIGV